jgi:predicted O-methyltransferase YrrM
MGVAELAHSSRPLMAALRNVLIGANARSLGLLRAPRSLVDYSTESLFLYKAFTTGRGLPEKNPFQVIEAPNTVDITLGNLNNPALPDTWFHQIGSKAVDIVNLSLICRLVQPRVVFEIGTLFGYTTQHLALNSPAATVYTLDLPLDEAAAPALDSTFMDRRLVAEHREVRRYCFDDTLEAERIVSLHGDSATFDFAPYSDRVDLFFIDGAHSYEYVRSDTLRALVCCHPGSVIAWHDFGRSGINGVTGWLREFSRRQPVYVVPAGSLAFSQVP